ncbi:MAG: hypothetical protein AABX19_04940 [Nanoarchaeota archaeon]
MIKKLTYGLYTLVATVAVNGILVAHALIDERKDNSRGICLVSRLDQYDSPFRGREIRFYDTDRDRRTVEQYVEINSIDPTPIGTIKDWIRTSETKPLFDPERTDRRKVMTDEETKKIDLQYQNLLKAFGEK